MMFRMVWRVAAVPLLVLALAAVGTVTAAPELAQAATTTCATPQEIGKKIPVVEVHGLNSNSDMWGPIEKPTQGTMTYAVSKIGDMYVTAFDYRSYNRSWVDNPNIGPKLADTIACLAASSRAAGGPGKVIAIGHSMGGLAIRWAATLSSNAKEVAKDLGLVITIGTPNGADGLAAIASDIKAALCSPAAIGGGASSANSGSPCATWNAVDVMAHKPDLPKWPANIAVRAIAGDVVLAWPLAFKTYRENMNGDLVVSLGSALAYSAHPELGGGTNTVSCSAVMDRYMPPPCWHSALTHNPVVEQDAIGAIKTYLAATAQSAVASQYVGTWLAPAAGVAMTIDTNGTGTVGAGSGALPLRVQQLADGKLEAVVQPGAQNASQVFKQGTEIDLAPALLGTLEATTAKADGFRLFKPAKLSAAVLKPYLDDWSKHTDDLSIHADSTGTLVLQEGPCSTTDLANTAQCVKHATFDFYTTGLGGIIGVAVSESYTTDTGAPAPSDFSPIVSPPYLSDLYVLRLYDGRNDVVEFDQLGATGAPDESNTMCLETVHDSALCGA